MSYHQPSVFRNYGTGTQNIHSGRGNQNINSGQGPRRISYPTQKSSVITCLRSRGYTGMNPS
ncbi:hypothetical protein B0H65DRAFT_455765 [Neurospora tetraspora]|uniref:NACHT-NTPase sigma domain-containing protein n=1 Tax=Neurospora tetraspora TaxID=94610 RepID=A0AAE0MTP1_9PEZI|nr:hypothetical protein B0H65DRAFT_455765 [Neurospora tetraspora]